MCSHNGVSKYHIGTKSKSTCRRNFSEIYKSTAAILLLLVGKNNKCLPCLNSTSGFFYFHVRATIAIAFSICMLNFVQIRLSTTELWHHIHSSRWRPWHFNSTSTLVFRDFAHLGMSMSTCRPNFNEISQSTDDHYYFRFLKTNVCHVALLLPVLNFRFASSSACHSASASQILSKLDHPQQRYDVISICQDCGPGIAILLPISVFVTSFIWDGRNLHAYQISASYLSPRLIYYYFQFLKTNVRHVATLLPVLLSRLHHHRHVILHLPTKFCPNQTIRDRVMTSYPVFKLAAVSQTEYFKVTADHWRSANEGLRSVLKF